jgi:DUF2933 family protein
MSLYDHSGQQNESPASFLTSRTGLVLLGFIIIAGALLFTEHRAHVLGLLLWLPIFACPLMHLFMHGGHGGHGSHRRDNQSDRPRSVS